MIASYIGKKMPERFQKFLSKVKGAKDEEEIGEKNWFSSSLVIYHLTIDEL